MNILKGTMYITDDPNVVYNLPMDNNRTRVISMDEDNTLIENDGILVGTCLLPPIEAKIAEADSNEPLYDNIYSNHLLEPYQQQFISAILSYLYKGGNFILFLPETGTITRDKFIYFMYRNFGVHIGIIGHPNPQAANWYCDERCIPLWLNMIYSVHVISAYEYLYMYPIDAVIQNNAIISDLVYEINPYADTINEKINYILKLHKLIHKNPNVRPVIGCSVRE